ncbi:hypothetical protein [Sinomonas sp. P47F7]|uniref:hypothetical protein n=1 Tax=Sinomonas sp. P47F7 TaxID=3410987 RepID=UPI003BF51AA7
MRALFRLSRAATVAGATVFLAAGAHTAAGGALPDPLILAGVLALVLAGVMPLSTRKISAPVMVAVLSVTQFALHEAFGILSETSASAPALAPGAAHVHMLGAAGSGYGGHTAGAHALSAHTLSDSPAMLAAHAIATLATALLLAKGEAALWALLAWLRPLVRLLAAAVLHPTPAVPAFTEELLPRVWRSLRLPALRGPPAAFAVA